jgi:hypothetical protein
VFAVRNYFTTLPILSSSSLFAYDFPVVNIFMSILPVNGSVAAFNVASRITLAAD